MGAKRGIPVFAVGLIVAAVGVAIYAASWSGFWWGAIAVLLVWWADNDRKRVAAKARDDSLIAKEAPELVGMSELEAMSHTFAAVHEFRANASASAQQQFHDTLIKHQLDWSQSGKPMPVWATVKLLRTVEAIQKVRNEKQALIDAAAKQGKMISTEAVLKHVEELKEQHHPMRRSTDRRWAPS